jgi:hypothetical protein
MPVPFDTHEVIQELQNGGFSQTQAERLSQVLQRALTDTQASQATKADVTEQGLKLDLKLEGLRVELHRELGAVKTDLGFLRWAVYILGALLIPVFIRTVLKI